MTYYIAVQMNKIQLLKTVWITITDMILSEKGKSQKTTFSMIVSEFVKQTKLNSVQLRQFLSQRND